LEVVSLVQYLRDLGDLRVTMEVATHGWWGGNTTKCN
jgi:hypothetical protein